MATKISIRQVDKPATPLISAVRTEPQSSAHKGITEQQLREAHAEGLSGREIGEKLGISPQSAGRRLRKLGLKSQGKQRTGPKKIPEERLRELHAQKLSAAAAGRILDITEPSVLYRWKKMGLEVPKPKGTKKVSDERLKALYDERRSEKEVSRIVGITQQAVSQRWKKMGLTPHGRAEKKNTLDQAS